MSLLGLTKSPFTAKIPYCWELDRQSCLWPGDCTNKNKEYSSSIHSAKAVLVFRGTFGNPFDSSKATFGLVLLPQTVLLWSGLKIQQHSEMTAYCVSLLSCRTAKIRAFYSPNYPIYQVLSNTCLDEIGLEKKMGSPIKGLVPLK